MRKDVRFGLAVGGVLLAVLIVYVIVASGRDDREGAQLTPGEGGVENITPDSKSSASNNTNPTNTNTAQTSPEKPAATAKAPAPEPLAAGQRPDTAAPPQPEPVKKEDVKPEEDIWARGLNTGNFGTPLMPLMSTTPAPGQSRPAIDTHDATPRPADTGSALTGADAARSGQTPSPVPTPVAGDTAALTPAPSPSLTLVPTGGDTTATGRRTDTAVRSVDTPSVPSTQPSGERTHKVQMGESFYSIAVKTYGNGGYYTLIQKANPTIEPDRLRPGQIINLPDPSEIKSAAAASTSAGASSGAARAPKPADRPIDAAKEYKVQSGDSLEKISIKLYGNRDQTEKLYDLNKSTIGDNPHNIKIGQILKLPSAPTVTAR